MHPALPIAYLAGSYYLAVPAAAKKAGLEAQAEADAMGKPLLNAGCGTRASSVAVRLFGAHTRGDINCDLYGPEGDVGHCNVYSLPWPDRTFGVALCSHVISNLRDPDSAMRELLRVADVVYVVRPRWWAPGSWFSPATERRMAGSSSWLKRWDIPRVRIR